MGGECQRCYGLCLCSRAAAEEPRAAGAWGGACAPAHGAASKTSPCPPAGRGRADWALLHHPYHLLTVRAGGTRAVSRLPARGDSAAPWQLPWAERGATQRGSRQYLGMPRGVTCVLAPGLFTGCPNLPWESKAAMPM